MKTKIKKIIRSAQAGSEKLSSPSLAKAYSLAKKSGLFDAKWYQEHYGSFISDRK